MNIICTTEIIDNSKSKAIRIILGAGCILGIICLVLSLIVNGKINFLFLIALIYFIPAYFRSGTREYHKDVLVQLKDNGEDLDIFMPEAAYEKDGLVSRKYVISKGSLTSEFNDEGNQIFLKGSGRVTLFKNDKEFHSESFEDEYITLNVKDTDYSKAKIFLEHISREAEPQKED